MPLPAFCCISLRERSPFDRARIKTRRGPSSEVLLLGCLALAAAGVSCSTVGSGAPAQEQTPSVSVQPNAAQLFIGGKMHFTADVRNASNSTVTWTIQQASGTNQDLGTIDASGNYVAPAALPSPANVSVIASLQSDATVTGSATITLQGSLAISPVRAGLTTSQALPLTVVTQGVSASDVTWSDIPDGNTSGGTILATASGAIYTPPGVAGTHTLKASLNANPSVTGQAAVYVTDFPGTFTWRNDNARSGINDQELALSPSTVTSSKFGKLFSCQVDGYVYAQPLYVSNLPIRSVMHNVVFVATENDSVYAFDADTNTSPCTPLWKAPLIPSGEQVVQVPSQQIPTKLLGPSIGITGTPVIDGSSAAPTLYVMAATLLPPASGSPLNTPPTYFDRLYAVDVTTGGFRTAGFSLASNVPGFSAASQLQRSALLLDNSVIFVAFGSNGATGDDYHGWLFEFDPASLDPTASFNDTSKLTPLGGGIWQSGGGPSADASHNVFVATGDGPPNQGINFSDSVVRMTTAGALSVADYFTPCDQEIGSGTDPNATLKSLSSAPLLLPDSAGLIVASKNGSLYLVNAGDMGNFCPASPSLVQTVSVPGGNQILSTPMYWNNAVYVAPGSDSLISFGFSGVNLDSTPSASRSLETFGPQGATPVISTNGTSDAVLWLIDTSGAFTTNAGGANAPAILRAYDPNDLSNELYDSAQNKNDAAGPAVKFTVPTVANGKVYVGTQTELDVYGLCSSSRSSAQGTCE